MNTYSPGEQYSLGLWETPSRHGTKIILVGTLLLVNTFVIDQPMMYGR